MTAVAEHILGTALALANNDPVGPLMPAVVGLDELPSTAPLPTLRIRMANERALGIAFLFAAQTWHQLAALFGEQEDRALFGLDERVGGHVRRVQKRRVQPGEFRLGRSGPRVQADVADRHYGWAHLLR
jgi:TraM recognition site of TraD and TraG